MGVLVAAGVLSAGEARACTFQVRSIKVSYPARDSNVLVPTNAVLFAYGGGLEARDLTLRTEAGQNVPIQVVAAPSAGFDVIPAEELAPNTRYVLEVNDALSGVRDTVAFTTGDGPISGLPEPELPRFGLWQRAANLGSCGRVGVICTDVVPPETWYFEMLFRDEVLDLHGNRHAASFLRPFQPEDCLEIRVRDVLGRRSQPMTICADEFPTDELGEQFPEVTCDSPPRAGEANEPTAGAGMPAGGSGGETNEPTAGAGAGAGMPAGGGGGESNEPTTDGGVDVGMGASGGATGNVGMPGTGAFAGSESGFAPPDARGGTASVPSGEPERGPGDDGSGPGAQSASIDLDQAPSSNPGRSAGCSLARGVRSGPAGMIAFVAAGAFAGLAARRRKRSSER
ncbi:MAG: hypothetical protein DIU78_014725 [Pseudomonadota bacterium]